MRRALALALALGALPLTAERAEAYCQMTTSQTPSTPANPCPSDGIPLAWLRPCLGIAIDERGARDLPDDVVEAALTRSLERWTSLECEGYAPGFQLRVERERASCSEASFDYRGENANVLSFVDEFEELGYDDSAFAVTIVWHSTATGEIYDADLLVNERFSPYAICPEAGCPQGSPRPIDLENVLTHEMGHFFGLAHSEVPGASMFARAPRGEISKRVLSEDDRAGLCAIYPAPLAATCDFEPHGGFDPNCGEESGSGGGKKSGCGCDASAAAEGSLTLALALSLFAFARRRRLPRS